MIDKIRLNASGELHPDFHRNLGLSFGGDGMCCGFIGVQYKDVAERVAHGGSDEEILEWCFEHGHRLNKTQIFVWNEFVRKFGWNDRASGALERLKQSNGLGGRNDIQTMFDYMEEDEGRSRIES